LEAPQFDELIRAAINGGVTCIQLRAKQLSTRKFIQLAKRAQGIIADTCPASMAPPLIINDRVDVAMAVNADGVHVGQDDMPVSQVRSLLGEDAIVGATVNHPSQVRDVMLQGADYLGTDAIFATPTKPESAPLGLERFAAICAGTSLPVLGIGGINVANCKDVIENGAAGVAVVSAIQGASNPLEAARALRRVVDATLPKYSTEWAEKVADMLENVRVKKPLVQQLTNYVVMNQTGSGRFVCITLTTDAVID
jgi:thiamine-phosphate pyrophosphorylase